MTQRLDQPLRSASHAKRVTVRPLTPSHVAWIITGAATLLAALLRLPGLDRARTLIFDETYYVKDAYSLAHLGYEGTWSEDANDLFVQGDFSGLSAEASYVVHPPTGKWLIAAGEALFGWDNPVGWRFVAALFGVLSVFLVCRIAWNLFHNVALTGLAGVFLATDGIAIVLSRIGILDIFVAVFVQAAFLAVIKDQQQTRPVLEARLHQWMVNSPSPDRRPGHGGPADPKDLGPSCGPRWWLLVAGVLLGVACSVKWNGIYALAFLGLFVALRDWIVRRRLHHPRALAGGLVMDTSIAFWLMVPTAVLVYVGSWWNWFIHPQAWGHQAENSGLIGNLKDWWAYHVQMWDFHNGLSSEHNYQAQAITWLIQKRPTSFYWEREDGTCGGEDCVRSIVALGNPLLWWIGLIALVVAIVALVRMRDWRVGVILVGYLAMYVPWLAYPERTTFTFYTVVLVPYLTLLVAWVVCELFTLTRVRNVDLPPRAKVGVKVFAVVIVLIILCGAAYFYTVWTGVLIPYDTWHSRMWLDSWI